MRLAAERSVTSSGGYTGGSPGAYRVVYGTNTGNFCGGKFCAPQRLCIG